MKRFLTYDILGSTDKMSKAQMDGITQWRRHIVQFAKSHPDEMYINGLIGGRKFSITFDDGPDSSITPGILDILKRNNVKASFFFLGSQINYFPGVVKRAYSEGHLILNHSWNHPYFTRISYQSIRNEILMTERRIESIIGKRPALIRPPYGDTDEKVIRACTGTENKAVIWSIDSMDWVRGISKQNIIGNVIDNARPGDIILMHSGVGQRAALGALQEIIDGLNKRGFKMAGLGDLLNIAPYK